jgi:hypothetical protein
MTGKKVPLDAGEPVPRTWDDYYATCERRVAKLGKDRLVEDLATDDFEQLRGALAKTRGPVALSNEIHGVRTVFQSAFDSGLIDRPIRFGPHFRSASAKTLDQAEKELDQRVEAIRPLLRVAGHQPSSSQSGPRLKGEIRILRLQHG